jgi:hypothetical protein
MIVTQDASAGSQGLFVQLLGSLKVPESPAGLGETVH